MSLDSIVVGRFGLEQSRYDPSDPRGQLLIWEPPQPWAAYVIGCDATGGIVGWNRHMRVSDEEKHDNAALEVFRKGGRLKEGERAPDVQVAEWVGPVDAEDLADICNYVGRLFGGNNEDGQALMCIECQPGTGWMTQRTLQSKYGYHHLPPWLKEGGGVFQYLSGKYGWYSSTQTRRDLWTRGAAYIHRQKVILNSPHFIEEMVDCTPDNFLSVTARALGGRHDDRVVAGLIALWYLNEWELGAEPSDPDPATDVEAAEWQASDLSASGMADAWDARVAQLLGDD